MISHISLILCCLAALLGAPLIHAVDLVSTTSTGAQPDQPCSFPTVSGTGRYVVFQTSYAFDPLDTNGENDVYRKDRATGEVVLVSASPSGAAGDGESTAGSISEDGRFVAFSSTAVDLVDDDTNLFTDIFVRDVDAGRTLRVSLSADGAEADTDCSPSSISANGSVVCFSSRATTLTEGNDEGEENVFVVELEDRGSIQLVSANEEGVSGDDGSNFAVVSGSGEYVAFQSYASDLVKNDFSGGCDVFRFHRESGTIVRVSVNKDGSDPSGPSFGPSISCRGDTVMFTSYADDLANQPEGSFQLTFVRDIEHESGGGETFLVSVNSSGEPAANEGFSIGLGRGLSADGQIVLFSSTAENLGGPPTMPYMENLYLHDRNTGETSWIPFSIDGNAANGSVGYSCLSADGSAAVFGSSATNAIHGDANGANEDIFAWPGTVAPTSSAIDNAAAKAALSKKIRKFKKKMKAAKRKKQIAKVKRFKKKIQELKVQLRRL